MKSFLPNALTVADFDQDGWPDLAVVANKVVYLLMNAADWPPAPIGGGRSAAPRTLLATAPADLTSGQRSAHLDASAGPMLPVKAPLVEPELTTDTPTSKSSVSVPRSLLAAHRSPGRGFWDAGGGLVGVSEEASWR
jgi:hypothetical protein